VISVVIHPTKALEQNLMLLVRKKKYFRKYGWILEYLLRGRFRQIYWN
jgi:hypothetical protein